ncbi:hypothetical protein Naga_100036g20 [Nannochloropsis gaditana]|uniref:Secreted protein n=1 Tax=Nannochloropsis gaditana TaxID=72520 RepID=W7U658_9STRA|nr:hypothetical protein Naga_100036g20 [Nannochloropsis gaditana]
MVDAFAIILNPNAVLLILQTLSRLQYVCCKSSYPRGHDRYRPGRPRWRCLEGGHRGPHKPHVQDILQELGGNGCLKCFGISRECGDPREDGKGHCHTRGRSG